MKLPPINEEIDYKEEEKKFLYQIEFELKKIHNSLKSHERDLNNKERMDS